MSWMLLPHAILLAVVVLLLLADFLYFRRRVRLQQMKTWEIQRLQARYPKRVIGSIHSAAFTAQPQHVTFLAASPSTKAARSPLRIVKAAHNVHDTEQERPEHNSDGSPRKKKRERGHSGRSRSKGKPENATVHALKTHSKIIETTDCANLDVVSSSRGEVNDGPHHVNAISSHRDSEQYARSNVSSAGQKVIRQKKDVKSLDPMPPISLYYISAPEVADNTDIVVNPTRSMSPHPQITRPLPPLYASVGSESRHQRYPPAPLQPMTASAERLPGLSRQPALTPAEHAESRMSGSCSPD